MWSEGGNTQHCGEGREHLFSHLRLLLRDFFPLEKKLQILKAFTGPVCFFFSINSISFSQLKILGNLQYQIKRVVSTRSWGTLGFKGHAFGKMKDKL